MVLPLLSLDGQKPQISSFYHSELEKSRKYIDVKNYKLFFFSHDMQYSSQSATRGCGCSND